MTPRHAQAPRRHPLALVAMLSVGVLLVVGLGGFALLHSRLFSATTVTVVGARHESARAVAEVAGLAGSPPLVSINPGAIAQRLESHFPWVLTASVARHWPHSVTISIKERHAVAEVSSGPGTWELVDATGRRLGPPGRGEALPRLTFATPPGETYAPGLALPAAAVPGLVVASTLPPAFASQVSVVQVASDGWVTLRLVSPVSFVLGPANDLYQKYEDVASVIARATLHVGDVVDVSIPGTLTVTGP